jgi:phospholipid/cholesterol/gamma-HCH transport system permease protein
MRTTEQIDALEIMGINTKSYLVAPKIVGALVVVPCLVVLSAVLAIWGGRMAGQLSGILAK